MKANDWKRVSQEALATDARYKWRWSRSFAFLCPFEWVANGVLAEASHGRSGEIYLWIVRLPLMVPLDGTLDLSWSDRYGGSSNTYEAFSESTSKVIHDASLEALENAHNDDLTLAPPGGADNIRMQEARAYSLLLQGNESGGIEVLRRIVRHNGAKRAWVVDLLARSSEMLDLVESQELARVHAQLRMWRQENVDNLRLSCD